jgi:hypothetical protein
MDKLDYEKLCDLVSKADSRIRFTGILDSKGDLIVEKHSDSVSLLNSDEVKMSVHYTFARWTNLQNLSYKLGKEKLSITEYEKVTLVSLSIQGNLFLLSIEPDVDYAPIVSKVHSIIVDFQN